MNKWGNKNSDSNIFRIVLFVSRNKDNKTPSNIVKGFKERRESFLTYKDTDELMEDFKNFASKGVPGEISRFYISVNARNLTSIKRAVLHALIDDDSNKFIANPLPYIAGIAALKENALTRKWMLDIDTKDESVLNQIKELISKNTVISEEIETPNGYHIIVENGFDTRELLNKFHDVSLKRDDLKFVSIATKV